MRSIILLLNVLQIFFFFLFYSQLFLAKLVILLRNSTVSPPLLRVFLGLTEQSSSSFFLFLISLNFSVTLSLTSSALALSDSAFFFVFSFPFSCSSSEDFHCLINFGFFNFNAWRPLLRFHFCCELWKKKLEMLPNRLLWDFKLWILDVVECIGYFIPYLSSLQCSSFVFIGLTNMDFSGQNNIMLFSPLPMWPILKLNEVSDIKYLTNKWSFSFKRLPK